MTITIVVSQQKSIALSQKDVSTLKDLKEQIKNEIGIPEHLQILVNKDHLVLSDRGFKELLQQGKDDISLKFFVKGSDDLEIGAICKEIGINSEIEEVHIHVFTSRQSILDSVQVSLGSKVSDIKNQLDEEYAMNKESFFLYHDHHEDFDEIEELPLKPIEDDSFLVDLFFKGGEFYAGASVQVMFKDNEDDHWASMRDTLTIPGIRLKNLSDNTVVLEFDGHDIIDTLTLKRKVNEKLGIPIELQVFYLDDFFWEECHLVYKFSSYCDSLINGFFEINFFIFPTEDTLVQKICTENNIFVFDPLPVISGNGTLFDYSFGLNSTVEDLFLCIAKELGIPAPHFVLIADGQELRNMDKKIANIFDITDQEYFYSKRIILKNVGIYIAVKGLSENLMNKLYLSKGIKALKTVTVFYHNKSTLVEKYSVSDIPTLDELSMKLRAHFGVFPPVLFFKNDYLKNQMQFHWKISLASLFFDEETKCYNENIDIFVCLDMASVLVGDDDIAIVNAFCSKNKVNYLQRVVVHFENQKTKELKVRDGYETIGKIKDLVDKLDLSCKGSFVHNGTDYGRGKRLLEIYFEKEDSSSDSLVFKYTPPVC
uniref:Ubiquitin-like domain-containing protein n=1 Tax=Clytia hemisphaerica TaxID=252671 RepID=A0A7M5XKL9_9CNID